MACPRSTFARLAGAVVLVTGLPAPTAEAEVTSTARDPLGGAPWAVRAWERPWKSGQGPYECVQVGRLVDGRLTRRLAGGVITPLGPHDRAVCGSARSSSYGDPALVIERLADDPARPTRLTRTIVAGVVRKGVTRAVLTVRGKRRVLRIARTVPRTFLVVLPGSVRRRDLRFDFRAGRAGGRIDLRTGRVSGEVPYEPADARAARTPLTVADPTGGPPLTVTRFAHGRRETCVEPGRRIAGEAGSWSPRWGSFLDAPTLASLSGFEEGDDWQPVATSPVNSIAGCTTGVPRLDDPDEPSALIVRRLGAGVLGVAGVLRRGERDVTIRAPDGSTVRAATRDGTFLAAVPSSGALHETMELRIGARIRREIATGEQDVPVAVESAAVRELGRVVQVAWTGGFEPFVGVDAAVERGAVRITPLERLPPTFSPEGLSYLSAAIAIAKCADVVLPDALVGLPLLPPEPSPDADLEGPSGERTGCVRVRPGERLTPVPDGRDPGVPERQQAAPAPVSPFR